MVCIGKKRVRGTKSGMIVGKHLLTKMKYYSS